MKKLTMIVLLMGVSVAYGQTVTQNKMTMQAVFDAFNTSNLEKLTNSIDKNVVDHAAMPGTPTGLEGSKATFKMFKDAFPDGQIKVLETIGEGEYVVAYTEFTGTNKGSLMGMPATGKIVKFKSVDLVRFNKMGKGIEHWGIDDVLSMMQQLGVAPATQPLPEIPVTTMVSEEKGMKTSPEQNKKTSAKFFESFSNRSIEGDLQLLAPDFKIWWNSEPVAHGAGTYQMLGETYLKAFSDVKWTPVIQVAEGDKVASYTYYNGTQTGNLMDFPASNKKIVNTQGFSIDHYKNGKIAERIQVNDDFSMLQQIGAIPMGK